MEYQLSPSILAADFCNLGDNIRRAEQAGAKWLHIDIMDGQFVPTISMGTPVLASVRKVSKLFLDVHIMAKEPDHLIEELVEAGADMITVHAEACTHLDRTLHLIRELGCKCGVAINPSVFCLIPYIRFFCRRFYHFWEKYKFFHYFLSGICRPS